MYWMRLNVSEYYLVIYNIIEIRGDVFKFVYKSIISLYCFYDMFCFFFLVIFFLLLFVFWKEYD